MLRPDFSRGRPRIAQSSAPTNGSSPRLLRTDAATRLNAERRWSRTVHHMLTLELNDTSYCTLLDDLQYALSHLCEAADAAHGILNIPDQDTGELGFAIKHGARRDRTYTEGRNHQQQTTLLRWVANTAQTLRIPGPPGPIRQAGRDSVALNQQQDCFVAAPVSHGSHNLGILQIEDKRGALSFDTDDVVKLELSCRSVARILAHLARC